MHDYYTTLRITEIFNRKSNASRTTTSVSKILSRNGIGKVVGTIRLVEFDELDAALAAIAAAKRGNPEMGPGQSKKYRQSPGRPGAEPVPGQIPKKVKKKG